MASVAARQERWLLYALSAAVFMVNLDVRVVAPLLPTLAKELDVSVARAGWILSAYTLPYGLFQLVFGPLADRFGKIPVCSWAMVAFSVGTACCSLWPSFYAIVTLRALTGAAAAGLIPLTLAYIGDTVPYEKRQATIAALMASGAAAQAFSTGAGGAIAALASWRAVFPCVGALAGLVTVGLFVFRGGERRVASPGKRQYAQILRVPEMRVLLALVAAEGFLFMGTFSYLSVLLETRFGLGVFPIGALLASAGVSQMVAALFLGRLLKVVTERRLLAVGGLMMACAYGMSAFSTHWWIVAAACTLMGVGFIFCHTTLQTRATEIFPAARGTAVALFAFSLFAGSGIGSLVFAAALQGFGSRLTFAVTGAALAIFTWIAVRQLAPRLVS
ncbi:MAG TPA: MFS transporter [Polyangiaceae bacterium]|nr:MFS transporter [Polyangiaceae bacterium]